MRAAVISPRGPAGGRPDGLAELQRRFWRLLVAPEGVGPGLAAVAVTDPGAAPLDRWIRAADEAEARERLDVYANMYFFRLREAIGRDLPRLAAVLGGDVFHNLVVDYLLAHPSNHPSLRHLADAMPGFLGQRAAGLKRPDLADLARLELARNDAFDAATSPRLEPSALGALAPEDWADLRFTLRADVRVLRVCGSTLALWQTAGTGEVLPTVDATPVGAIVWRPELAVRHRAAALDEVTALEAIRAGASFSDVCEIFAEHAGAEVELAAAAARAHQALRGWLGAGLLAGFS